MQQFFVVDAFTDVPFCGNPAAVCVLREFPSDEWMQSIASEINLSETAFVVPAGPVYRLRWFTPGGEVDLCGHATLGTAHALWHEGFETASSLSFETRSGVLGATRDGRWITLDFPAEHPSVVEDTFGLANALGAAPSIVLQNRMDLMAVYDSEDSVRGLTPNMFLLSEIPVRGIIATAAGNNPRYDFVSRFFAPRLGVPEDPVTGSAHCALAPYWSQRIGRSELTGYQASRRGGTVRTVIRGDRVLLSGQATSAYAATLNTRLQPIS